MRKVNRMIKFIIFVMLFTTTLSAKLISIGGRSFDVRRTCDEIYNILEKEDSGK